jgi:hypothetical protein
MVHYWAVTVPSRYCWLAVPQRPSSELPREQVPLVNFLDRIRTLPVMLMMIMIIIIIIIIIIICTVTNYVTYHGSGGRAARILSLCTMM